MYVNFNFLYILIFYIYIGVKLFKYNVLKMLKYFGWFIFNFGICEVGKNIYLNMYIFDRISFD